MNHHLQEQRRIAAQDFLKSLEQLGAQIKDETAAAQPTQPPQMFTMDALEAAVTDIEHMLEDDNVSL